MNSSFYGNAGVNNLSINRSSECFHLASTRASLSKSLFLRYFHKLCSGANQMSCTTFAKKCKIIDFQEFLIWLTPEHNFWSRHFSKQSCCRGSNSVVLRGLGWFGALVALPRKRKCCYLHDLVMPGQNTLRKIDKKNGSVHFS